MKTDTPKEVLEIQYDLYRKMSPAKKFRIVCDAYRFGQSLAMAGIKMRYPSALYFSFACCFREETLFMMLFCVISISLC